MAMKNVLPPLSGNETTAQLPADPTELLSDEERAQLNADLGEMARKRRITDL